MDQPYQPAPDVHVLPTSLTVPGMGTLLVNSFVFLADEPVVIDAGLAVDEPEFIAALADIVDPSEIRWVWLTHDDTDHTGSLPKLMELAPQARLVTHALGALRMSTWWPVPLERVYAIRPGDEIVVGDRTLTAVQPPLFDNPMSTGLLDRRTGYLFSVDSFGALLSEPTQAASDIPDDELAGGMAAWATFDSPWTKLVDRTRFGLELDRIEALGCSRLFSSHLPPADGADLPRLRSIIESVPELDPFVPPSEAEFAGIVAAMTAAAP